MDGLLQEQYPMLPPVPMYSSTSHTHRCAHAHTHITHIPPPKKGCLCQCWNYLVYPCVPDYQSIAASYMQEPACWLMWPCLLALLRLPDSGVTPKHSAKGVSRNFLRCPLGRLWFAVLMSKYLTFC